MADTPKWAMTAADDVLGVLALGIQILPGMLHKTSPEQRDRLQEQVADMIAAAHDAEEHTA